jgi:hypothetical protein
MPDEDRSDYLPYASDNEPSLQRAILDLLLDVWPKRIKYFQLAEYEQFREVERRALMSAVKSLHIGCLVVIGDGGEMVASSMSQHLHWLMTEVEPFDA